ncbi:hypothetical protein BJY01DRAFT_230471 [Aspergillus pseudoustus]|uniref:Uncharacterized protein n=1 Tax=Aspergillus pseudoustus TaxID=1810923 RepID=A0ABR4IBV0_9EURO
MQVMVLIYEIYSVVDWLIAIILQHRHRLRTPRRMPPPPSSISVTSMCSAGLGKKEFATGARIIAARTFSKPS